MSDKNAEKDLIEYLQQQEDSTVQAIQTQAEAKAEHMQQQARLGARRRVSHAIAEERDWLRQQISRAHSSHETRQKHAERQQLGELGDMAWSQLASNLNQRWQDKKKQTAWIEAAVTQAQEMFGLDEMTLTLPKGAEPNSQLMASLEQKEGLKLTVEADESISGGFKVHHGSIVFDATIDGLLSDAESLQGRLMQLLRNALDQQGKGATDE